MSADAFLRRIAEDPGDIASRLVFADWLEGDAPAAERDPARAEFIRVQVKLANCPAVCPVCGWGDESGFVLDLVCDECARWDGYLRQREDGLLGEYGGGWARPVAAAFGLERWGNAGVTGGPGTPHAAWCWHRGFVEEVTAMCQAFLDHGPAVVLAAPIRRVTLSDKRPVVGMLGLGETGEPPCCWLPPTGDNWSGPSQLPLDIYLALPPGCGGDDRRKGCAMQAALEGLSTACVAWARKQAGLPELAAVS